MTLLAFDAAGNQIAASPQTLVAQNAGVHTLLSVSTPFATIVGFKITARTDGSDDDKQIAIDDLTFDTPTTPAPPDFTLTPATTNVNLVQGAGATDAITIGRLGGSNGLIDLAVSGTLPTGVHAALAPYATTIDIGGLVGEDNSSGAATVGALEKLREYVCSHGEPAHGADVGVEHNDIRSAQTSGNCWQDLGLTQHSFAFVNSPQPLVSVAHELFHLLGLFHASAGCGSTVGV